LKASGKETRLGQRKKVFGQPEGSPGDVEAENQKKLA